MIVVVSGVKGSGKTTTINYAKEQVSDLKILSYGDYFVKLIQKQFGKVPDREFMEERPRSEHLKMQADAAKLMKKDMKKHKNVIIDTNLFFIKPEGLLPGLPQHVLEILQPDVIVVLEVNPENVLERRLRDERVKGAAAGVLKNLGSEATGIGETRKRHAGRTVEDIQKELEYQRLFAFACANQSGCTVKVVDLMYKERFPYDHAKTGSEEIVRLFKK